MARKIKSEFKFKPFSKKQKKVLTWWLNETTKDYDGLICDGAVRSGKTISMSLSFLLWSMTNFKETDFVLAGKTVGALRRNVLNNLLAMARSIGYTVNEVKNEGMVQITGEGTTNTYYIYGGTDARSIEPLRGLTAGGALLDEVNLMPRDFVVECGNRCSAESETSVAKIWMNCNPDSSRHWFKLEYLDNLEKKNLLHLHFLLEDNLTLSEKTKEKLIRNNQGVFYDRYILGLWVTAEGLIFKNFTEEHDTVGEITEPLLPETYISVDYGTSNAMAYLKLKQGKRSKRWYVIDEYYYQTKTDKNLKDKTNSEFLEDLKGFAGGDDIKAVIVDPSAKSFRTELKRAGYKVIKAKNDVLEGIRFTQNCFAGEQVKILRSCVNTLNEIYEYRWDTKRDGKPVKENDHAVDALRYFCYTVLNTRRKRRGIRMAKY